MRYIPFIIFSLFIGWMIFLADTNQQNFIMKIGNKVAFGDKIGHFSLFGILSALLNLALRFRTVTLSGFNIYKSSVLVLSFALLEEISQLAFPNRTFDLTDVAFDILGVITFSSKVIIRRIRSIFNYGL
ncbi:MAG: VanZ family protein [Bacteroidota bacterium]